MEEWTVDTAPKKTRWTFYMDAGCVFLRHKNNTTFSYIQDLCTHKHNTKIAYRAQLRLALQQLDGLHLCGGGLVVI